MEKLLNVLIVDDDDIMQEMLGIFLRKKFNVYTAGSVSGFYQLIDKMKFDLILLDNALTDTKTGIQLTSELRASEKHKTTPVLMISSFDKTKVRDEALAAGVTKFLLKPIRKEILENEINKLFFLEN